MEDIELAIHGDDVGNRNSRNSYFKVNFGGGSYIKGLIAHLSSIPIHQGTFVFTPTNIHLTATVFDDQVANVLNLDTSTFPYIFENDNNDDIIMTISLKDLASALSQITKASGVILEKERGKDQLHVILTDSGSTMPLQSRSTIKFIREDPDQLHDLDYAQSPGCYVKTSVLAKMFNTLNKNKSKRVECYGSKAGIKFVSRNDLATNRVQQSYGEFDEKDETSHNMIALKSSAIKSMIKITSLNGDGEVRIFYSPGLPYKFTIPVGNYGTIDIFVSDMRTDDEIEEENALDEL